MSHSQFRSKKLILRHAWLNLWDKHMTTGRINQVEYQVESIVDAPEVIRRKYPRSWRHHRCFSAGIRLCRLELVLKNIWFRRADDSVSDGGYAESIYWPCRMVELLVIINLRMGLHIRQPPCWRKQWPCSLLKCESLCIYMQYSDESMLTLVLCVHTL